MACSRPSQSHNSNQERCCFNWQFESGWRWHDVLSCLSNTVSIIYILENIFWKKWFNEFFFILFKGCLLKWLRNSITQAQNMSKMFKRLEVVIKFLFRFLRVDSKISFNFDISFRYYHCRKRNFWSIFQITPCQKETEIDLGWSYG